MSRSLRYPTLRDAADRASAAAQRTFLLLQRLQLISLVFVAGSAGWPVKTENGRLIDAVLVAAGMLLALIFSLALQLGKFDDKWFRCRAYAENVKSAAWKYCVTPVPDADNVYLNEIQNLRTRFPNESAVLYEGNSQSLITDSMRAIHLLNLAERATIYKKERAEDQIKWYSQKANFNQDQERIWYWVIFAAQFLGVVLAVIQIWRPSWYNSAGLIAALASSLVAWLRVKRFSDLGVSYGVAAGDLRLICDQQSHVDSEESLKQFVDATEAAISREHSIWLAKRQKLLPAE